MAESIVAAVPRRPAEHRAPEAPEFPGCHPVYISRDDIADYEGRYEFWDADTETAMVCEPTSYYHERPSVRLAGLARTIAQARGSPIEAVGHTDLLLRNARGERQRIMQADQILFLRPVQTIPRGKAIEVGMDALPDVVLEVDNTTDVRHGKLGLYESWGFPEVWVEVPDEPEPNRPRSLRPGLTIHVRGSDGFRTVPVSRAFPGWAAEEIHRALNEATLSDETARVLNRVGMAMGAAQGTGPDDDPFLRRQRGESRAEGWVQGRTLGRTEGHAEGRAQGRTEGHAEGRAQGRTEGHAEGWAQGRAEGNAEGQAKGLDEGRKEGMRAAVLQVFESRGIPVSASLPERLAEMGEVSTAVLVRAAMACRDEEDFLRLARRRSPVGSRKDGA